MTDRPTLTDRDLRELRESAAELAPRGCVRSSQVLALLAERDHLRRLVAELADRCHAQSEALSKKAEKEPDTRTEGPTC